MGLLDRFAKGGKAEAPARASSVGGSFDAPGVAPEMATHFFVTPRALAALREQERSELSPGESLCFALVNKPDGMSAGIYKLPYPDLERLMVPAVSEGVKAFVDKTLVGEVPAFVVDHTAEEGFVDVGIPPHSGGASNPGRVRLSFERLLRFHPDFFEPREGFDALEQSALCVMRMLFGDTRAAVVVGVRPNLVVAAYSDDLDAVALLRFSPRHADEHQLSVGSRLVTVNTYTPGAAIARDLHLGPEPQSAAFCNFHPSIADLLSEDRRRLAELHQTIPESEWKHARELGEAAMAAKAPTRSGRPLRAGVPAA